MKFLILIATIGLAAAAPQPTAEDLRPAIGQILALIDVDTIVEAINRTDLTTCENYTRLHDYLAGPKFATIHNELWTEPEFLDILKFISESGIPEVYDGFNKLFEFLNLPYRVGANGPIDSLKTLSVPRGTEQCNETALAEIIQGAIPTEEVLALVLELLQTDPSLQALFFKLSEPEKGVAYHRIKALPEIQDLIQAARDAGIEIDVVLALLENILGYTQNKL